MELNRERGQIIMYFRFDSEYKSLLENLDRIREIDINGYKFAQELKKHLIENYQNCLLEKNDTEHGDFTHTTYWKVDFNKKHTLKDIIDYLIKVKDYSWFNGKFKDYKIDIYNGKIIEYRDEKLPADIFNIPIGKVEKYAELGKNPELTITFYEKGGK